MSVFRESLVFFENIGLYDVVLPFLLVFTLVFGILEKSKIFGTEMARNREGQGEKTSRKNLNAMVAFVTAFFVVASAQLVSLIHVLVSRVALVLVILVMLMLLIASFHPQQGDEGFSLKEWKGWLSVVVLIAVVLIFLDGVGWLLPAWEYATHFWDTTFMGTLFLLIIVLGFIIYLTRGPNTGKGSDSQSSGGSSGH
jgi:small-conductance mechanosensitive channel